MDINDYLTPRVTTEETAAKTPRATTSNPVEYLSKGLLRTVATLYETFRHSVAGSFFNAQVQEALATNEVQTVLLNSVDGFTAPPIKPALLRDRMSLKPGDGKKVPITLEFFEFIKVPNEVLMKLQTIPAKLFPEQGSLDGERVEVLDFLTKMEAVGQTGTQQKTLDSDREQLESKQGYVLFESFFKAYVAMRVIDDNPLVKTVQFRLEIEIDAGVYPHIIRADKFSAYLVNLWAITALSPKFGGGRITDPRIAAAQSNLMQSKFGALKPKLNAAGYGVFANGMPIYVPPATEAHLTNFLDKADTCVDTDGYYSKKDLVEVHKQNNRIVYVDWLNDIMAYTTNMGTLQMVDLGDVVSLDPATEYAFLDTPLNGAIRNKQINAIFLGLDRSIDANVTGDDAMQFAEDDDTRRELSQQKSAGVIRMEAMNTGGAVPVTIAHFCGQNHRTLIENDLSLLVPRFRAYQCMVKAFMQRRREAGREVDLVSIPDANKAQGILFRLIGFEYIANTIAKMSPEAFKALTTEYVAEIERRKPAEGRVEFDVPNMHTGPGGFTGFLPHQARILSSKVKNPLTSIDPVSTGGGKTILSFVDMLMAMDKNPGLRGMITTKGRLVKGTITEINQITKGKINAIPFRPLVLFRMVKRSGIGTFAALKKWFEALPPNTVFVNSFSDYTSRRKIYPDVETVGAFANMGLHEAQYLAIVKLLNFDFFVGDESHLIKNPDAARSTASYAVMTRGKYRRITSGTIVSNTVKDIIGQARAITPAMFGTNVDTFAEMYDVSTGLIQDDETARIIKDRMKSFSAYHEATREDWSYMLPVLEDKIDFCDLTPLQAEYYKICMTEAEMEILKAMESKKARKDALRAASGEDEDDDDSDDDDDDDDSEDPDEAEEETLLQIAKFVLQRVEMFLVAPDQDERYVSWKVPDAPENHPKPSGMDLISPKVALLDAWVGRHLAAHAGNMAKNKIIIFGVNKVASVHYLKYSKYATRALHYTAGDEETVRKYTFDDNQFLMVANETALREGENLQMTSLILRQQAVWSPGDHEQAVARMYRPDPRGRFNRADVQHVWCMTRLPTGQPTLDGVKIGRLASKAVSNARMTYENNPSWRSISNEFDDLEMLRMNATTLFTATTEGMQPYWDAWKTYTRWEGQNNLRSKRLIAMRIQRENPDVEVIDDNGNIKDINAFVRLAMSPVTSTRDLPGSKRVYCPWVINAIPPDPKGYGFEIIGRRELPPKTVVLCEYGPAIVLQVKRTKGVIYQVQLSTGAKFNIPGAALACVPDPKKYAEFSAIVKNPTAWAAETFFAQQTKLPALSPSAGRVAKPTTVDPGDIEEITDDDLNDDMTDSEGSLDDDTLTDDDLTPLDFEDDDATTPVAAEPTKEILDVFPVIINALPALMVKEDVESLGTLDGWNRVDPHVLIKFRDWDSIERFIEFMYTGNNVHMSDEIYNALQEEAEEIKTENKPILTKRIDNSKVRNFFLDQRKKLGLTAERKIVVKPYFLVTDKEVRMAFDIDSHHSSFINYLLGDKVKAKVPGIMKVTKVGAQWINIFQTGAEARKDLMRLMEKYEVIDPSDANEFIADVIKTINALAKPRRRV